MEKKNFEGDQKASFSEVCQTSTKQYYACSCTKNFTKNTTLNINELASKG